LAFSPAFNGQPSTQRFELSDRLRPLRLRLTPFSKTQTTGATVSADLNGIAFAVNLFLDLAALRCAAMMKKCL
jgi:hypothetical protein